MISDRGVNGMGICQTNEASGAFLAFRIGVNCQLSPQFGGTFGLPHSGMQLFEHFSLQHEKPYTHAHRPETGLTDWSLINGKPLSAYSGVSPSGSSVPVPVCVGMGDRKWC